MATIFGDRWEIITSIGEGGQAHTFLVKDLSDPNDDGTRWVLKRLKNDQRLGRFEQEAAVLKTLDSPRIPRITDFSVSEPAYLVLPFAGKSLEKVVREENLTFDEGFDLVRDVAEAVVHAHEKSIVHRDIKPNNVVVDLERGLGRRAHLIDFGICQWDDGGLFTTVDGPLGNRSFAPPEFELGSAFPPTTLSDVYSLGKLLYYVITGGQYIPRENLGREILSRIPQPRGVERNHIHRLLKKVVVEDPDRRSQATTFLRDLERAAELMRAGANAVGTPDQICPTCRSGILRRRNELTNLGYNAVGNPGEDVRLLHCDYCGFLQHHFIGKTRSKDEELWEI